MGNKTNRPSEGTLRTEKVKRMRPKIFERAQNQEALLKALDMLIDEVCFSDDPDSRGGKSARRFVS